MTSSASIQALHRLCKLGPAYGKLWNIFSQQGKLPEDEVEVWAKCSDVLIEDYFASRNQEFFQAVKLIEDFLKNGDEQTQNMAATCFLDSLVHRLDDAGPRGEQLIAELGPEAKTYIRAYNEL